MLVFNCYLKTRRWRHVEAARSGVVSSCFVHLRDLPRPAYELIANEAVYERKTKVIPKWKEECGWGLPHSEYENVHFKSVIAKSIHIVEMMAKKRDSRLKFVQDEANDVELYLDKVRRYLGEEVLEKEVCREFVAFYRNARIVGRECSETEFRSFLGVLRSVLRKLEK